MNQTNTSNAFWRSLPIFEDFDSEAIASLTAISTYRKWLPETVIFQRGDEGNYMVALLSGRIKLSIITSQGRELLLRQVEGGSLFGEMAMLDGQPRSADATAASFSEGYIIARKPFMDLIGLSPSAATAVIGYLCRRLRETTEQLETIALYGLNARVARFFLATLREIHGDELPATANLRLSLSQSDIAEILGASRPKINRAIIALEENGGIKRVDNIIECNTSRLRLIADPREQ